MEPVIQTVILKRFRSIVAETVHFDNPTFLVGRNGSGKSNFERIGEFLQAIVPNLTQFRPVKHGKKLALEFTQQWGKEKPLCLEASSMSDGTLRALGLLTAVYQYSPPSLLTIKEPEAARYPEALPVIVDLIQHASHFRQVVVTTHSPDLLDAEWIEGRHLRIVTWADGTTHIAPLSRGTEQAIAEQLGRPGKLMRSNALRGPSLASNRGSQVELFKDEAA